MVRFAICFLAIVSAGLAGCGTDAIGWDAPGSEVVNAEQLAQVGLGFYWRNQLELVSGEQVVRIWRLGDSLYCLTDANRIHATDAATGAAKWSRVVGRPAARVYAPCHADRVALPATVGPNLAVHPPKPENLKLHDVVIFNTTSRAMVLARKTGKVLHDINLAKARVAASTGCASDGSQLFVGSMAGRYYAVDLITGLMNWQLSAEGMVTAAPTISMGMLYVANQNGLVSGTLISGLSARKVWPKDGPQARGAFSVRVTVDQRGVFAGCRDYGVYCFDPPNGRTLWRFRTEGPVEAPVQAGKTNLYATATLAKSETDVKGPHLYAIDLSSGQRAKWTISGGVSVLAETETSTLVINDKNELLAVDTAIGTQQAVVPMAGLNLFVPNARAAVVYAAAGNGRICCIRPLAAGYLTPDVLTDSIR